MRATKNGKRSTKTLSSGIPAAKEKSHSNKARKNREKLLDTRAYSNVRQTETANISPVINNFVPLALGSSGQAAAAPAPAKPKKVHTTAARDALNPRYLTKRVPAPAVPSRTLVDRPVGQAEQVSFSTAIKNSAPLASRGSGQAAAAPTPARTKNVYVTNAHDAINPRYLTKRAPAPAVPSSTLVDKREKQQYSLVDENGFRAENKRASIEKVASHAQDARGASAPANKPAQPIATTKKIYFSDAVNEEISFFKEEAPVMCATGALPHAIAGKGILKARPAPLADDLANVTRRKRHNTTNTVANAAQ